MLNPLQHVDGFVTLLGASWVWSETGRCKRRAGRDLRKWRAPPGGQVAVFVTAKGADTECCLGRQLYDWIPAPALQISEVYKEAPTVLGHVYTCRCSQCHITNSRPRPWGSLWGEWERKAEPTFEGQGREWGASEWHGPAHGAISSPTAQLYSTALRYHILFITWWIFGCFYTLALMNNEAINMYEHIFA